MRLYAMAASMLLLMAASPAQSAPSVACTAAARHWLLTGRDPDKFEQPDELPAADCVGAVAAALKQMDDQRRNEARVQAARANLAREKAAQQRATEVRAERELAARPSPAIGMHADLALTGTNWGRPTRTSSRTTANGTVEIWHFGTGRSLTIVNGRVAAIDIF